MAGPTMSYPTMSSFRSAEGTLDRSATLPASDPKSDLDSVPDGAAAADRPAFSPTSASTMSSSPSPAATLDRSSTPPPSDPKSDLDSLPDSGAAADRPAVFAMDDSTVSSSPSAAATLDRSPTPPPSDPKSDLDSLPDGTAAADPTAPSVPSVVPADEVGESNKGEGNEGAEVEGEGEEEEEECGFCIYMKSGGCKDSFVAWEKCVERAEKSGEDIVEKCSELTGLLKNCMDAHADYYEPILRAEKAMVEVFADTAVESHNPGTEEQNEGKDS